ncbi:MAG: erythromycin esterase family protein [bacterium]|nr:erythromycin esterase family protein [bacterium]
MQPLRRSIHIHATPDDWIGREAVSFSLDSKAEFDAAVAKAVGALGDRVELLGIGEPLHGGEEILILRNRLFRRLAAAHGFTAIAVESSFPRGRLVNGYVAGRGPATYDEIRNDGFSHGFGLLEANRELVEWMRAYNADPSRRVELRFYGFDGPLEMTVAASPGVALRSVLDYLESIDPAAGRRHRGRIEPLLGRDADWENPAAAMDPTKAVGLSSAATALRIATEDLITELRIRRPELAAGSGGERLAEALHDASMARQLLNYHAALARESDERLNVLLGIRDAIMADNLVHIVSRERGRGKVLAFAHNAHLQRGMATMQLGPHSCAWWPAGAHLDAILGTRYAVIGSAVGVSAENGIGRPEEGTLEALLTAVPGPALFIPTHAGSCLPPAVVAALPTRSGSARNPTYFALTPRSLTDFDWLVFMDAMAYTRGGPSLPEPDGGTKQ